MKELADLGYHLISLLGTWGAAIVAFAVAFIVSFILIVISVQKIGWIKKLTVGVLESIAKEAFEGFRVEITKFETSFLEKVVTIEKRVSDLEDQYTDHEIRLNNKKATIEATEKMESDHYTAISERLTDVNKKLNILIENSLKGDSK